MVRPITFFLLVFICVELTESLYLYLWIFLCPASVQGYQETKPKLKHFREEVVLCSHNSLTLSCYSVQVVVFSVPLL